MATKKSGGSSKNNRDSIGKRLGFKCVSGQYVTSGSILVRQRGMHIHPGPSVLKGRDYTLFANTSGLVQVYKDKYKNRKYIKIIS